MIPVWRDWALYAGIEEEEEEEVEEEEEDYDDDDDEEEEGDCSYSVLLIIRR